MSDECVKDLLIGAMRAAEECFDKTLSDKGYDPSYFELYLEGWVLSCDFKRMERITIDNSRRRRDDK